MPCNKCSHILILGKTKDELICPRCEGMNYLDKDIALKILQRTIVKHSDLMKNARLADTLSK